MRILLSCDKTRGHLFPALSFACHIKSMTGNSVITFQGLKKDDWPVVKSKGFKCVGVDFKFRNILLEAAIRFLEALFIIFLTRPGKVIGFGGRNSFFIVLLCRFLFIPVFIFEPNTSFGQANKVLSIFVRRVFTGLKIPGCKKEIPLGVPLRGDIIQDSKDKKTAAFELGFNDRVPTILVFGGSLGSSFINDLVVKTFILLDLDKYKFGVIHLTGKQKGKEIINKYKTTNIMYRVYDYYEHIGKLYSAADLVISRSGASTVAEICFFGKPAIFIPYPYAYRHQRLNACFLSNKKAALLKEQKDLNEHVFYCLLRDYLENRGKYSYLGKNAGRQKVWASPEEFSERLLSCI